MNIFSANQVFGDVIPLKVSHPKHILANGQFPMEVNTKESFSNSLVNALNEVNTIQQQSSALSEAFIKDPDSVDVHDITIAMAKANMSVQITKAVLDGDIKAYREIINIR